MGILIFLLLAEAAGRLGLISRSTLPLTSSVLKQAVLLASNREFLSSLGATMEAWALGMAITVAVGVPAGLLLGSVKLIVGCWVNSNANVSSLSLQIFTNFGKIRKRPTKIANAWHDC